MKNEENTGYIVRGKYQFCKVKPVLPQGAIALPVFLIICNLSLGKIDSDIANYADDKTPYTPANKNAAIEWFEEKVYKLFGCFFNNYLRKIDTVATS